MSSIPGHAPVAHRSGRTAAVAARRTLAVAASCGILALAAASPAVAQSARSYDGPKVVPFELNIDLRFLPAAPVGLDTPPMYRPLLKLAPRAKTGGLAPAAPAEPPGPRPPMPATIQNFAGMNFNDPCAGGQCGGGWPPDTNGEVGPNHYVEAVNVSYAIYSKTGTLLAAFRENQLWASAGAPPCTGSSQGDPIVVYDPIADRWILTHFAFSSAAGPFYQCLAVSKTGDPVAGGWWLYALRMDPGGPGLPPVGTLNDYPKFGSWHDCLYMGANGFQGFGPYAGAVFGQFSRADLYNGNPLTWALGFIPYPTYNVFSMFPAHSAGRGATAVQPGTPEWFVAESIVGYSFDVYTFTPGPNCSGGTLNFAVSVPQASYSSSGFGAVVPQPNTAVLLDNLADRIMQKVQYRKVGAAESLWVVHTVPLASNQSAIQWAQLNVTGGTAAASAVQQQIYSPDTTLYRFMPSIAADNQGNVAVGFSTSGSVSPNFPSINYAGRLASDPLNTLPQTEVVMTAGAGSQNFNCGGGPCDRWGDYTAMSVDPVDDCTFWYTNQYYSSQANGNVGNWQTRIGSFKFPGCTAPVATVQRTFVKSDGLDTDPCTIFLPCRTFDAAMLKTSSGGEIIVLDSAGYGAVAITKPLSLIAPPGVYAGVAVFSGTGIVVNPVVGKVTLRGLTINQQGGATGIDFQSGDALSLDNVIVTGFPAAGLNVLAAATGTVQIHDSIFRGNAIGATFGTTGGTTATLKVIVNNSSFDGNTTGVRFTGSSAQGEIRGTTIASGTTGALLVPNVAGAVSRVDFIESTITKNSGPGVLAGGSVGTANVSLSSSLVSGNTTGVQAAAGGNVFLTDSTVTRNSTGLSAAGGTIASGTQNRLYNNSVNGSFGSTVPRQ